jgi:hypothetical protein
MGIFYMYTYFIRTFTRTNLRNREKKNYYNFFSSEKNFFRLYIIIYIFTIFFDLIRIEIFFIYLFFVKKKERDPLILD